MGGQLSNWLGGSRRLKSANCGLSRNDIKNDRYVESMTLKHNLYLRLRNDRIPGLLAPELIVFFEVCQP